MSKVNTFAQIFMQNVFLTPPPRLCRYSPQGETSNPPRPAGTPPTEENLLSERNKNSPLGGSAAKPEGCKKTAQTGGFFQINNLLFRTQKKLQTLIFLFLVI